MTHSTSKRWQLHESTVRGLCRVAFVVCAFLPVCLTILLVIGQRTPVYHQWLIGNWERQLSEQLGVTVDIVAVETMTPTRARLHGVKLSHPESRVPVGRIRTIDIRWNHQTVDAELFQLEIDGRQLRSTSRLLHDGVVCHPSFGRSTRVIAKEFSMRNSVGTFNATNLTVDVRSLMETATQQEQTDILASCDWPASEKKSDATRIELRLKRFHDLANMKTLLELDTKGNSLPCNLLADALPSIRNLGSDAQFMGRLELIAREQDWQAEFKNAFLTQIDFGQLSAHSTVRLSGQGLLWMEQAAVNSIGLQKCSAVLRIGEGRIDQSLLSATQRWLGVSLPREIEQAHVQMHSFNQLEIGFAVGLNELKFIGRVDNSGTIVADSVGSIAVRSNGAPIPLQNVVGCLHDASSSVNTASTFSSGNWLTSAAARWLPLLGSPQAATQSDDGVLLAN